MKLVTFLGSSGPRLGALTDGGIVVDLQKAGDLLGQKIPGTMQALIEAGPSYWNIARDLIKAAPRDSLAQAADTKLCSPLPRPVRMRDCQLFLEHLEAFLKREGRSIAPEYYRQILYYNADHLHIFGPEDEIRWPRSSTWIDYELEWACVIGQPGVSIPKAEAGKHIFGYTIFNDWSARDLQFAFQSGNLGPGGGKDFATSLGPCIATPDEFKNPYALRMTARVNGEQWSCGTTASMHWSFEDAIAMLSEDRALAAGEIIASGTVLSGCGLDLERKLGLNDVVELEVEGIGVLRNRVVPSM
jgi:2-keto-4-pentenoate hydratase/2-oxohepta-3-ene-1,7-dioic acid hydratase in catechol pathway